MLQLGGYNKVTYDILWGGGNNQGWAPYYRGRAHRHLQYEGGLQI